MKLVCWFDIIDHSKLFSILWNDQLVNFFKNIQVVLIFFLGFYLETLCSSQFCEFELNLDLIFYLSSCIMSFNLFMHHIVLLVLYFFCANLLFTLGFVFFLFLFPIFAVCSCSLILAPCLGRLELIGFPLPLLCLHLGFSCLGTSVLVRLLRNLIVSVRFGLSVLWS